MAGEETELDEFYLREPEDQFAWYTAYAGEDWAAYQHPELTGAEEDGGDESFGAPRPEGCYLEMVEAVYGELTPVENEEDGFTDWIARPEAPAGDGGRCTSGTRSGWTTAAPNPTSSTASTSAAPPAGSSGPAASRSGSTWWPRANSR
jgi:hypothetical protein